MPTPPPEPSTGSAATGAPVATRPARRQLPRSARQAQLVRAAATAFARQGYAATSMDDVAAEAGVTKLIVYRHFASKDELYRTVLTKVADRLREEFAREHEASTPGTRPAFATRAMLTVAREDPDGFRLLTCHAIREADFSALVEGFVGRARAVADAIIADMIPDPVVKAWATPVIVDYLVEGVLTWLEVGEPARDDEFVGLAADGLLAMFLAWADPDRLPDRLRRGPVTFIPADDRGARMTTEENG